MLMKIRVEVLKKNQNFSILRKLYSWLSLNISVLMISEISVSPTPGYATSSLQLCHYPCRTSSNSQLYNGTNICVRPVDGLSSTTSSSSSPSSSTSSTHSASDGGTYIEHNVAGSNVSIASDASCHTMTCHRVLLVILVTCHCLWMTDPRRTLLSQTFYRATGLT